MTQIPAEAFPVAVFSGERRATPDQFKVESSETAIILWLCGEMIGVSRTADDTNLQAALTAAFAVSQSAERYGALIRDELERRQRARVAEPTAAAMRAAQAAVEAVTSLAGNDITTQTEEVR
ncbi:hypothetical protein ACWDA3_25950 [Nonomuraea rubra]